VRGGHSVVSDDRLLLGRERRVRSLVRTTVDDDGEPAFGDQRLDVDLDVECPDPHLREPEAVLLDEVEAQDVAPGRSRRHERCGKLDRLPRRHRAREGSTKPIPHDRVPARVEPVIGELQTVLAARPPRRRAVVHEDEARGRSRPGSLRRERPLPPGRCERLHGAGV